MLLEVYPSSAPATLSSGSIVTEHHCAEFVMEKA